ncbi:hypothetical protein D3C75_990580 [compost metagenome]
MRLFPHGRDCHGVYEQKQQAAWQLRIQAVRRGEGEAVAVLHTIAGHRISSAGHERDQLQAVLDRGCEHSAADPFGRFYGRNDFPGNHPGEASPQGKCVLHCFFFRVFWHPAYGQCAEWNRVYTYSSSGDQCASAGLHPGPLN